MAKRNYAKSRTDLPVKELHINMSNALARSAHGLKLHEKRIVSMALAKSDSRSARDLLSAKNAGWVIRIAAVDYAEAWGVEPQTAYEQLQDAANTLIQRQVRQLVETPKGMKEIKTNWCGQCIYHPGEGWVEIAFTPQIAPHLLGLREKFTSYKLRQASALRSVYSWRLMECLHSWGATGQWKPTIDEFCHAMEAPESCRKDFGNLRMRVIEPAVHELRQKDNLAITVEPSKQGRKVIGLTFRWGASQQGVLDLETPNDIPVTIITEETGA